MRIFVCVKQILDPEVPAGVFKIDASARRPVRQGIPLVMDSYAANALEVGLQLRERVPAAHLTVLCLGDDEAEDVLRDALALTADEAIRVWDPSWCDLDGLAVAHVLGRAIAATGGADVVLCGREAGDVEEGVVGPALAEELGAACVTLAERVEPLADGELLVQKTGRGERLSLAVPIPAVITVTSTKDNVLRMAKVKDRMLARRKRIRVLAASELDVDAERLSRSAQVVQMRLPEARGGCEFIDGADAREQAVNLVRRLRERKIV